jgi:alkylhydroperoxidase family enzyme
MEPMLLTEVERATPEGPYAGPIAALRAAGMPVPQIMHLFAYKPATTGHLSRFTEAVMRGPSPLAPGWRELIAAFTSRHNRCLF